MTGHAGLGQDRDNMQKQYRCRFGSSGAAAMAHRAACIGIKKKKIHSTPALFRKAMRCPAAIVGLPVLLTRIPEKGRMEKKEKRKGAH